jgi:crossover junction endodeoxyribonuclease RusA
MEPIQFTVEGDPVAKGRPRFARGGHAYTPKRTADAEREIKAIAQEIFYKPRETPVGMQMTFYCKTKRRTDGDNLAKLVSDALNGVAFVDDYLVEESYWRVLRAVPDEDPRTEITVYDMEPS